MQHSRRRSNTAKEAPSCCTNTTETAATPCKTQINSALHKPLCKDVEISLKEGNAAGEHTGTVCIYEHTRQRDMSQPAAVAS